VRIPQATPSGFKLVKQVGIAGRSDQRSPRRHPHQSLASFHATLWRIVGGASSQKWASRAAAGHGVRDRVMAFLKLVFHILSVLVTMCQPEDGLPAARLPDQPCPNPR
jgi:hypothetical protein